MSLIDEFLDRGMECCIFKLWDQLRRHDIRIIGEMLIDESTMMTRCVATIALSDVTPEDVQREIMPKYLFDNYSVYIKSETVCDQKVVCVCGPFTQSDREATARTCALIMDNCNIIRRMFRATQ